MRAYDPVCGMWLESNEAATRLEYAGNEYFFCALGCKERFEHDPGRFLDPDAEEVTPDPELMPQKAPAHSTQPCPYCGEDAQAVPVEAAIGKLSLNEFEAMVRSEWRHRLGRRAYRRHHPRELIRALLIYALEPWSAARESALEQRLTEEVARLRAAGLTRPQIQRELFHLSHVIWKLLNESGIPLDEATKLMATMDGRLLATLEWKVTVSGDPWRFPS